MKEIHMRVGFFDRTAFLVMAMLVATPGLFSQTYVIVELQTPDDTNSVARGLNNNGDVVGRVGDPSGGQTRGWQWKADKTLKVLKPQGNGEFSGAMGISDSGDVVGTSNEDDSLRPVLWTAGGDMQTIPILPNDVSGQAFAINNAGHVVG